jgi:hypothetical protein
MTHKIHIYKTLENNKISLVENECGRNPKGNKGFIEDWFTVSKKEFVNIYKTEGTDTLCTICLAKLQAIAKKNINK